MFQIALVHERVQPELRPPLQNRREPSLRIELEAPALASLALGDYDLMLRPLDPRRPSISSVAYAYEINALQCVGVVFQNARPLDPGGPAADYGAKRLSDTAHRNGCDLPLS